MYLSDLPPELHTHIVEMACTDMPLSAELSNAGALSLVSPYWHQVANPFRYHSIRVGGPQNIAKLSSRLESLSEREKRVRYLSLSDAPLDGVLDDEQLQATKSNIERLLALLTPSLYALELHLSNPAYSTSLIAVLWELPAPNLVSLSVKGYYPFPTAPLRPLVPSESKPRINALSNFPRLERLSLDGVPNPSGLLSFNALEQVFPNLGTLEVRGLRGALAFAHEVAQALQERDNTLNRSSNDTSKRTGYALRLPSSLRRLSLFPAPEPLGKFSKRGTALHNEMLKVLVSLTIRDVPKSESALQVFVGESDFC